MEDESSLTGNVPLYIFKDFIIKMGPSLFLLFLLTNILEQILHAGGIVWLADWSDSSRINTTNANEDATFRLGKCSYSFLNHNISINCFFQEFILH